MSYVVSCIHHVAHDHIRVYEIMNSNYSSGVSFTEFVNFCATYLVLDEARLMEFTFKLLSRRGVCMSIAAVC